MKSKLSIDKHGSKRWKLPNGNLHREDGLAIEYGSGDKEWWVNGKLHRENGPAIEDDDGDKYWFLKGIEYSEQEYKYEMRSIKLKLLLK